MPRTSRLPLSVLPDYCHTCVNYGRKIVRGTEKRYRGFVLGPKCFLLATGRGEVRTRRIMKLLATIERQPDLDG